MKNLFILISILTFHFMNINAQNKITIEIKNVSPVSGHLMIGLYDSNNSFLKTEFKSKSISVDSNIIVVEFDSIPNGLYAISTFHDANDNGKMDKYFFGLPKEGYAFSNNAKGMFGPASFEDASFEIKDKDVKQVIKH